MTLDEIQELLKSDSWVDHATVANELTGREALSDSELSTLRGAVNLLVKGLQEASDCHCGCLRSMGRSKRKVKW